ncbi:MAG: sugar phosphate isomerase/epimerase [Acidobacteriia bacterium]|nr:sugar phosphate isomerase/epimerase [Terriglobia bacterium]
MAPSRRHFLAATAAATLEASAQTRAGAPRARTGPVLCLDSRLLPQIDYSPFGTMLNALGFDGCDLAVEPGGLVSPEQSPVDMVRAIEVITGEGLEVPVVTTAFQSINEPWARNVLALCARSGVVYFRTAYSKYPDRLISRRNDIGGLVSYARAARIGLALPYPDAESLLSGLDPAWAGYDFDTAEGDIRAALPRIRTIVLHDYRKDGDHVVACKLGEGTVDWNALFSTLAHARFSGPLTIAPNYPAPDKLDAIRRDLDFARKQLNTAYQKELSLFDSTHETNRRADQ